ncbi:transglutaminase-like domain-containing protein [Paenibacillus caseinilyticus]|uniref:Transglutaminase n=1 Tax=Paenibacillus mucilaginosus K02 TaxID=997761 RepID=I0BB88_9BACL|nr:transglutaminase-like domain-containing protein [Paenibacillus mucilaginosus]AFH59635.2 transglutaminase [Paenibacillus mucilaginosus K02]
MPYGAPEAVPAGHTAGTTAAARRAAEPSLLGWGADAGLTLLLFLLLVEWLYPLRLLVYVTEVYAIGPFVLTFALLLLADTFRLPAWAVWPVKAAWIITVTAWLHAGGTLPSVLWWEQWGHELLSDAQEGLRGELAGWEPATRTLLFLSGWAFFLSVVQSFVLERRSMLWFGGLTLFYLGAIEWIFGVDMGYAALRSAGWTLLLQSCLQSARWDRWRGAERGSSAPALQERAGRGTLAAGVVLAACCLLCGWFGTLLHPGAVRPPDWSAAIRALEQGVQGKSWIPDGRGTSAQTGYGADDTKLGHPLTPDSSPAFMAVTPRLTYWRGEAKSFYTGQGWTEPEGELMQDLAAGAAPVGVPSDGGTLRQQVTVQARSLNRQLFAGGTVTAVTEMTSESGLAIPSSWVWKEKGADRFTLPALSDPMVSYTVESRLPAEEDAVRNALPSAYPPEILQRYLQLPDSVSARVRALAQGLTENGTSPYAKVKAVEDYLQSQFAYSLQNTRAAEPGEDLVDRFLFEQKTGYCDHFSSSMVVLLRASGIPARWVKGFTPGEVMAVTTEAGGKPSYTVQVRQRDAHSWVEVYFPQHGWVAFDPTPALPAAQQAEGKEAAAAAPAAETAAPGESVWQQVRTWLAAGREAVLQGAAAGFTALREESGPLLRRLLAAASPYAIPASGAAALALAAFAAYALWRQYRRLPALPGFGLLPGLRRAVRLAFAERLWRRLQRAHGRAAPAQTLREYAASRRCAGEAQQAALLQLAQLLEALRYADPRAPEARVTRRTLTEAWRQVKRSRRL